MSSCPTIEVRDDGGDDEVVVVVVVEERGDGGIARWRGTNRDKSHPDEKRGEQNPSDKPKRNLFLGLLGQGGIVFGDSLGAF
jgi:hypothetical protein